MSFLHGIKKGVSWTNCVVSRTDELQNGIKIYPGTLEIDEDNGALSITKM